MEEIRKQYEGSPKNLRLHPEETIAALARVEGNTWEVEQKSWSSNNIAEATAWLKKVEGKDPDEDYVLYGAGGLSRWLVNTQGEVSLLRSSSNAESIRRAQAEGFKII